MRAKIKNVIFCALPIICLVSIFVTIVISRGLEITPDSITYLFGASNLKDGQGFSIGCSKPVPNTTWGPGYSIYISSLAMLGLNLTQASVAGSIIAYILLLIGVFVTVHSNVGSRMLAVISVFAVGLHPVILRWEGAMLSDSFAWLFMILIVLGLLHLIQKQNLKSALFLGVVVGLSLLVRYAYFGFAVGCMILIIFLLYRAGLKKTLKIQFVFCSVAFGILGMWLLRNYLLVGRYSQRDPGEQDFIWSLILHFLNWWDVIFANFTPHDESIWQALILIILFPLFFISVRRARELIYGTNPLKPPQLLFIVSSSLAFCYTGMLWVMHVLTKSDIDTRMFSPIVPLFAFMMVSMFHQEKSADTWNVRNIPFAAWSILIMCIGLMSLPDIAVRSRWYAEWKDNLTMKYVVRNYDVSDVMVSDVEPFWYWYEQCPNPIPIRKTKKRASELAQHAEAIVWIKRVPGYAPAGHRLYLLQPSDIIWDVHVQKTEFNDGVIYDFKQN